MIVQGLVDSFFVEMLQGIHDASDTYRIALYTGNATLSAKTKAYTTDGEVFAEGYGAGGQPLTGYRALLDRGFGLLDWDDPVWQRATITARGALIYNYSKLNRALAVLDLGKNFTSTNGTFTIEFPEATADTALIAVGAK